MFWWLETTYMYAIETTNVVILRFAYLHVHPCIFIYFVIEKLSV